MYLCAGEGSSEAAAPAGRAAPGEGVCVEHAVFVPPDSSYNSLGPRTEAPDLSWQEAMQHVWDSQLGPGMTQVILTLFVLH